MSAIPNPPQSYPDRFLKTDVARDYACQEYGAKSYATAIWKWQEPLIRELLEEIHRKNPSGRHLDFACGTGRITILTETIFPEVDALDISPAMVEIAREACQRAHFSVGNVLEDSALCPGPYSSVSTFRLLLNLDPPLRRPILACLNQRLESDGMLLLNLHGNRHSLRQPAIIWKKWRHQGKTIDSSLMLNDMSLRESRETFEAAGFQIERIYGIGFLPPTVYRWPLRSFWQRLDRFLCGLPFLKRFCIDLIFLCRKKGEPAP
jgi:SAM-dependent methyltransferase